MSKIADLLRCRPAESLSVRTAQSLRTASKDPSTTSSSGAVDLESYTQITLQARSSLHGGIQGTAERSSLVGRKERVA